jgi:hypothetical protein
VAEAPADAVDRLYGLPREDFVGERDALAKELRADGRRDEAAAVKALSKPTVAAWAANQAVRSQKKSARDLWKAGDQLSAAHDAVLAGKGSGGKLREATERERAAVERLVEAARGLLSASGGDLSEATIERVRETLHAGAIDPDARAEVAGGRSARERTPQGLFGGGADVFAVEAPTRTAKAQPKAKAKAKAAPKAKGDDAAALQREREEAAERKREEAAARKREREEAAARERELKAAADRVTKARRALAQAEERSAKAAERLEQERAKEREADEALAAARAELRTLERG